MPDQEREEKFTQTPRDASGDMTWNERLYVPQLARGVGVLIKHFFVNLFGREETRYQQTLQYPEQRRKYSPRHRSMHRLTKRDDGAPKCVACYMCATNCPAKCIHIIAAESPDPQIEKYPQEFVIDELRCIFCGFCVEACPKDAITMDTGIHVPPCYAREESYFAKDLLLANEPEMDEKK